MSSLDWALLALLAFAVWSSWDEVRRDREREAERRRRLFRGGLPRDHG